MHCQDCSTKGLKKERAVLSPMSASVSPVAAPVVAQELLKSQPLYHSRGSGSFSGIAYSVPGVSQRSAHIASTVSGAIGFPAVPLLQRGRESSGPSPGTTPVQWQLLRHRALSAHDQPALYTNVQAHRHHNLHFWLGLKIMCQGSSRVCDWVSFQNNNSCTHYASGGLIAVYRASCHQNVADE